MAVYGKDFYGLTKYGSTGLTEFGVEPFTANPFGYETIKISWHRPLGTWDSLRLLQSKQGYAANSNDGTVVLDLPFGTGIENTVVNSLVGGTFYYFTLFIKISGVWQRAGATSALALKDTGMADLLWERIPKYLRSTRRRHVTNVSEPMGLAEVWDPDSEFDNPDLRKFLEVIGWGLDYLNNYTTTLLNSSDPYTMHLENLDRLLRERGTSYEYGVPPRLMRSRAANSALLARKRGTFEGLKDDVALATGFDIDLNVGPNLMLNEDQSSFASPLYAEWNSGINYPIGQRVQFSGRIYRCILGALGDAQKPPTFPTASNTWWTTETALSTLEVLRDAATGGISSWRTYIVGGVTTTPNEAIAFASPVDVADNTSNSLEITNTLGTTQAIRAIGAANVVGDNTQTPKPDRAVKQGIPIPRTYTWSATQEFHQDDLVDYLGIAYRALDTTTGSIPPTATLLWEKVGYDTRPLMAMSFYAQGDQTGAPGSGGAVTLPEVYFFDDKGTLLDFSTDEDFTDLVLWDTFNVAGTFSGRVPDQRWTTETWAADTGSFTIWDEGFDQRVAYSNTSALSVTTVAVPAAKTQYRVAVDFVKDAAPGRTQALVLRWVDTNNWFRVTRTKVQKNVAGVVSDLATHSSAIVDGDRVEVQVNDTSGAWTVRKNGTSIATGTGFITASTPYKHGMMVQ